jgi:ABC-type glycerol-3-phosphate transport system substrate-binding protein
MNRRFLSLLLFFSLIFSACQTRTSPEVPLSTSTAEAVTTRPPAPTPTPVAESSLGVEPEALKGLTINVWHPWYGAPAALFDSQVAEFNSTNTWGITVQATGFQNYTELYEQVSEALDGPDRPDVVVGLPEYAVEWHVQDAVVDLNPYVADPLYGLPDADVSDFSSVFWEQDQLGGARLGMPAQRTARLLVYNQSWASELGFETPPSTAQEFREQACKANLSMRADADPQNDGRGGWLIDTHPITALSWLLAFGGGAQEQGGFRFLTPANIEAARFVKGLSEDDCAWKTQNLAPLTRFVDRSALFATASLDDLPDLARAFASAGSTDEWTVLPFPGPEESALVVYGSSYIVLASEDTEQLAAWLFVRWLLSPENQADWVNSAGMFPLQASTMGLLADYTAGHPQWAQAVKLLPQGRTTPEVAAWRTVRVALGDGFSFMFRVDTPVGQVPAILAQLDTVVRDLNK